MAPRAAHPSPTPPPRESIQQAADRMGVSHWTIRRLIADGTIPAYRLGRRLIRLDPAAVDAALAVIPTAGGDDAA